MGLRPIQGDEERRDGTSTRGMVSMWSPPLQSGLGFANRPRIGNRAPTVREGTVLQRSGAPPDEPADNSALS